MRSLIPFYVKKPPIGAEVGMNVLGDNQSHNDGHKNRQ
jgi:hypothetical protein